MQGLRKVYDLERRNVIKNLPLLKLLKAQIDEVARVASELQQAELEENWEEFEKLQLLHTQLLVNEKRHTSTTSGFLPTEINSDDDFISTGPIPVRQQKVAATKTDSDDDFIPTDKLPNSRQLRLALGNDSDEDFILDGTSPVGQADTVPITGVADDDFVLMETISVEKGHKFASVPELHAELQRFAKANHFSLRSEKDSIVCSNAGYSTSSRVNNTKALAERRRRQREKETQDDFAFMDDSQDAQEDNVRHIHPSPFTLAPSPLTLTP